MKKQHIQRFLLFMILLLFSLCAVVYAADEEQTVADGIYLEDIFLGGMSEKQAENALKEYIDSIKEKKVKVSSKEAYNGESPYEVETTLGELGLTCDNPEVLADIFMYGNTGNLLTRYKDIKDLEAENLHLNLEFSFDEEAVQAFISERCADFNVAAVDAGITRENGEFHVTESVTGITVDEDATIQQLIEKLHAGALESKEDIEVELIMAVTEPSRTTESLSTIGDLLGTKTTSYSLSSSQAGRNANLVLGTSMINGTVIMPGEVYSANAGMEPYTAETGWQKAASYTGDGGIEYTYGGGICQISTTFYNAALLAELEIVQRQPHSMVVGYVPYGLDAAIAGSYKDLKIMNNYDTPIYIECYANGGSLVFNIYGQETRASNRTLKFTSDSSRIGTPAAQYVDDDTLPLGQEVLQTEGQKGGTSISYKEIYIDGQLTERIQLSVDTYRSQAAVYRRGTNEEMAAAATESETTAQPSSIDPSSEPASDPPAQEESVESPSGTDANNGDTQSQDITEPSGE